MVSTAPAGGPGLHQIALGHQRITHPAGNRRADLGPLQVEPGGLHRGLCGADRGAALGLGAGPAIELLPRDRLHIHQLAGSLHLALGQCRSRAGPLQLRLGTSQVGLVGPRIDLEQDLALPHLFPFGEGDPLDVARDPGLDLHLVHRLEPAGELVPFGDLTLGHLGYRDRLRRRRGGRLLPATHRQGREGETSQGENASYCESPGLHVASKGIHRRSLTLLRPLTRRLS